MASESVREGERVSAPTQPAAGTRRERLFVIQNPVAGTRRPERLHRQLQNELATRDVSYEHAYTRERGHGTDLVRQALEAGFRRFLVAGGDGTIREAVSALAGSGAALALLPVGTGNQLAANLGVPKSLRGCISVALGGDVRDIDLGLIDGRPFAAVAGAGLDARVVEPDSRLKRRVGYLAYVQAATAAVIAPRLAAFRVRVDGTEILGRGIGVMVMNMPGLTAPGLRRPVTLVPGGRMDDGRLDGLIIAAATRRESFLALGAILRRRQKSSGFFEFFSGREIEVEADPPLPVQADGELLGETPFHVKVWPGALRVLVPAK